MMLPHILPTMGPTVEFQLPSGLPLQTTACDSGLTLHGLIGGLEPNPATGSIVKNHIRSRLIDDVTRRAKIDVPDVLQRMQPSDAKRHTLQEWQKEVTPESPLRQATWQFHDHVRQRVHALEALKPPFHDVGTVSAGRQSSLETSFFLYHYMTTDLAHTVGYLMSMPLSFFAEITAHTDIAPYSIYLSVFHMLCGAGMIPTDLQSTRGVTATQTDIPSNMARLWQGEWLHYGIGNEFPQYAAAHDLTRDAISQMTLPFAVAPKSQMRDQSSFYLGGMSLKGLEVHVKNSLDPQVVIWVAPFHQQGKGFSAANPQFTLQGQVLDLWNAISGRF